MLAMRVRGALGSLSCAPQASALAGRCALLGGCGAGVLLGFYACYCLASRRRRKAPGVSPHSCLNRRAKVARSW